MKFAKGSATLLVEDPPDPMTVDYRVRCVVRRETHDVVTYGVMAGERAGVHFYGSGSGRLVVDDVRDTFDHSAGRGLRPGQRAEQPTTRHFFTQSIRREMTSKEQTVLMRQIRRR